MCVYRGRSEQAVTVTTPARLLIEALKQTRRQDDLAEVFAEAWNRGPHWHEAIRMGLNLLPDKHRETVLATLQDALLSAGENHDGFGGAEAAAKSQ